MSHNARTVWCDICEGPSDVIGEGIEVDRHGTEWWARLLDCGHEEVTPR